MKHTFLKTGPQPTKWLFYHQKNRFRLLGVLLLWGCCLSCLSAQDFTWEGDVSDDWTVGGNWAGGVAPTATTEIDILTFQAGGQSPDPATMPATIHTKGAVMNINLVIPSGTTLTVDEATGNGIEIMADDTLTIESGAIVTITDVGEHGIVLMDDNAAIVNRGDVLVRNTGNSTTNMSYHGILLADDGVSFVNEGTLDIQQIDLTAPSPGDGINLQNGTFTNAADAEVVLDTVGGHGIVIANQFVNEGEIIISSTNANGSAGDLGHGITLSGTGTLTNGTAGDITILEVMDGGNGIDAEGTVLNLGRIQITDIDMTAIVTSENFCNEGTIDVGNFLLNLTGLTRIGQNGIQVDDGIFNNKTTGIINIGSTGSGMGVGANGIWLNGTSTVVDSGATTINGVDESGIFIRGGGYTLVADAMMSIQHTGEDGVNIQSSVNSSFTIDSASLSISTGIGRYGINNNDEFNINNGGIVEIGVGGSAGAITGNGLNNTGNFNLDDKGSTLTIENAPISIYNDGGTITNDVGNDGDFTVIEVDGGVNMITGTFNNNAVLITTAAFNTSGGVAGGVVNDGLIADLNGSFLDYIDSTPQRDVNQVLNFTNGVYVPPYQATCQGTSIANYLITGLADISSNQFLPARFWQSNGTDIAELLLDNDENILELMENTFVNELTYDIIRNDGLSCGVTGTATLSFDNTTATPTVCNGGVQVSLGAECIAVISPDMILEGEDIACSSGYTVEVLSGSLVGTDSLDATYVGQTVMVKVTGPDGNSCWGSVTVEDKLPPILACRDTFVYCQQALLPDSLGYPVAVDACGGTVTFSYVDSYIDPVTPCGQNPDDADTLRTVLRLFTAFDQYGNSDTCTQRIYVLRPTIEQIQFPVSLTDTLALQCGVSSTNTSPATTGYPFIVVDGDTARVDAFCTFGIDYNDQRLNLGCPGKIRIRRLWTVMDWCNRTGGLSLRDFIQIIDIVDTIAPAFTALPDTVQAATGEDRSRVTILSAKDHKCMYNILPPLPQGLSDGCSTPYYYILGPTGTIYNNPLDSFINVPVGEHQLEYIIADSCGNESRDTVYFELEDQISPLAIAHELTVNLVDGNCNTWVYASSFDAGSYDNCTEVDSILIKKPGVDTFATAVEFCCGDTGNIVLTLRVVDASGNAAEVDREVQITDKGGFCPVDTTDSGGGTPPSVPSFVSLAGQIQSERGEKVEAVTVFIEGYEMSPEVTGVDGSFYFEKIPTKGKYKIVPNKDLNHTNGVSTYDLVLLSQHILGIRPITSPYQLLAGDINNSGHITAYDMVRLRQLILGIQSDFPNNHSWRFVDASYQFAQPENPFEENFPEAYDISSLESDMMTLNFVAVKVGDLNGSAIVNRLQAAEGRDLPPSHLLETANQVANAGEEIAFEMTTGMLADLAACQFTLEFDGQELAFERLETGPHTRLDHFNLGLTHRGLLPFSWNRPDEMTPAAEERLFRVIFKAKKPTSLQKSVWIGSSITAAEGYTKTGAIRSLQLTTHTILPDQTAFELFQNTPNPFQQATVVAFNLPKATTARLTVFDMAGKVIFENTTEYKPGYQEFTLEGALFDEHGLYYYQLATDTHTATRKMMFVK